MRALRDARRPAAVHRADGSGDHGAAFTRRRAAAQDRARRDSRRARSRDRARAREGAGRPVSDFGRIRQSADRGEHRPGFARDGRTAPVVVFRPEAALALDCAWHRRARRRGLAHPGQTGQRVVCEWGARSAASGGFVLRRPEPRQLAALSRRRTHRVADRSAQRHSGARCRVAQRCRAVPRARRTAGLRCARARGRHAGGG